MFNFLRLKMFYRLCVTLNLYRASWHYFDDEWQDPSYWLQREDRRPLLLQLTRMRDDGRLNIFQRLLLWFIGTERYGIITGRETITKFKENLTYLIDGHVDDGGRRVRFYKDLTTAIDAGYIQVIEDILNLFVSKAVVNIQKKKDGFRYVVAVPDIPRNSRRVLQGTLNNQKHYEVLLVSKSNIFGVSFEVLSLHHQRLHNEVKVEATTSIYSDSVLTYTGRDDG